MDVVYADASVNVPMPTGWGELTDSQLMFCYGVMARGVSNVVVQLHCLLRWGRIRVERLSGDGDEYRVSIPFRRTKDGPLRTVGRWRPRLDLVISGYELVAMVMRLLWIRDLPEKPVRPGCVSGRRALPVMLDSLDFETYLVIDNHLQGWLHTERIEHLRVISDILFPLTRSGKFLSLFRRRKSDRLDALDIASLQWVASLKLALSRIYPHILKRKSEEEERKTPLFGVGAMGMLAESVNAQLRALTKGDITKENEVRRMPYRRALTELDAMAKESEELRQKLKK